MKSYFVFYKSRASIESFHSPRSFQKATERNIGGFGSIAKNKPHPNTPTDCAGIGLDSYVKCKQNILRVLPNIVDYSKSVFYLWKMGL